MDDELHEFLAWERTCRGAVDFKPIYVDMAGDLIAGLMLSQLVYWCLLPDAKGKSRLRVCRDGHMWAAKSRSEWWDEIRLSPKQADRAIRVLANRGLVVRKNSLFNGKRTPHLRINWHVFRHAWLNRVSAPEQALDPSERDLDDDPGETSVLTEEPRQCPPKGNPGVDQRSIPITETTAEPTTTVRQKRRPPSLAPPTTSRWSPRPGTEANGTASNSTTASRAEAAEATCQTDAAPRVRSRPAGVVGALFTS